MVRQPEKGLVATAGGKEGKTASKEESTEWR
jgi:hypothetical protein